MKGFLHMTKKKIMPVLIAICLIIIVIGIIGLSALIKKYTPSKETEDLNKYFNITSDDQIAVTLDDTVSEYKATSIDGKIYVDYNFVNKYINSRFYWDANENVLLYATSSDLISVSADSDSYYVTKTANDFGYPIVKATSDSALIALDFVKQYSNIKYDFFEDPSRIMITSKWGDMDTATVKKDTQLRIKGGIKSPILKQLKTDDTLTILESGESWAKALTNDGIIGYVKQKNISAVTTATVTNDDYTEETYDHIKKDSKICLAWHQVTNKDSNSKITSIISGTKGVNIISPTWFYLNDNKGSIADLASADYVSYCHSQGIEVWGLVSNLENNDVDSAAVLTHTSTRSTLVNQIIAAAIKHELDGINLDFENLTEDAYGDSYIEFVRELAIKCHNNGICLSVDVTVPASYNKFFNRSDMANFADYIIIMGYDEHYKGSDAGSVASINWVNDGVTNTLDEVPADQVILGMPFYTRIWSLTPKDTDNVSQTDTSDSSNYTTSSSVYGMEQAAAEVLDNQATASWDSVSGQNYAEWTKDNVIYKVWLEDSSSMEERLKLVTGNSLAGAAFWKLGFETSSIWDTVIKYIN